MNKEKIIFTSGRRKTAVAKVRLSEGNGKIIYNGLPYENLGIFHRLALQEPVEIGKKILGDFKFDVQIHASGGGKEAQVEAGRQGIAKALVLFTNSSELKKAFIEYDRNILVADKRRKEAYKPGDSKARAKRQTSYR